MNYAEYPPLEGFLMILWDFFVGIIDKFNNTVLVYSSSGKTVSLGSILFAAIVIGFAVSLFWKGARAE